MAVCAYFVAQALSTYIASLLEIEPVVREEGRGRSLEESKEPKLTLEDYQVIADRNIFNSAQTEGESVGVPGEEAPVDMGELGPAVKSSLDASLVGTLVVGDGADRRSSALVSSGKAKSGKVYFVGDEEGFAPSVKLMKVEKGRIEFLNGSRLEYIAIEDDEKGKSIFATRDEVFGSGDGDKVAANDKEKPQVKSEGGEGLITIEQKELDEALANLDRLYSEVRIVPNFQGGQSKGLKLLSVKPGSLVSKLGIRRGDVLEKINGEELDLKKGMELFGQLKDMKNFSVDIVRGGKNQTMAYEIR